MKVPLTALLTYYRNSLADADRMAPEDSLIQNAIELDQNVWSNAQLPPEQCELLWNTRNPNGKTEIDEWGRKRFWFCPWVGTLKPEHGAVRHGLPQRLVPLWIPVRVTAQGNVEPDPVLLPWIPRNLLDPIYPARLVLGHVHEADTYIAANQWAEPEPLDDETPSQYRQRKMEKWLKYGYELVEYVTKQQWSQFNLEEYYHEPHIIAIPAGSPSARISGLLAYYDALIRDKITTPPLQRLVDGEEFKNIEQLVQNDDPRALHIAHLPGFGALSNDQRDALHKACIYHPDVLAVHGPPGTGKTKWIAELTLQAYVESALKEEAHPPIQIWIAGTNQAILSSLNTLRGTIQGMRWAYPQIRGLGIWCAAKSQQKENTIIDHDWLGFKWNEGTPEGSPTQWGNEDSVIDALHNYQLSAQKYFGIHMELDEIKQHVLKELTKSVQPLRTTWRLLSRDKEQKNAVTKLLAQAKWPTTFEEYTKYISDLYNKRKKARDRVDYIWQQWNEHVQNTPIWVTLTASLPGSANRFAVRNKQFFDRFNLMLRGANMNNNESIEEALTTLTNEVKKLFSTAHQQWQDIRRLRIEKEEIALQWLTLAENWMETPRWYEDGSIDPAWELRCDTVHRTNATMWALRYWEAVYLQKRIAYYSNARSSRMRSRYDDWKELSCLTPMLAVTLHSAPRFFQESYDERDIRPMYGMAHRIIIEEASQLAPDAITGLLTLGRTAVFIGDEKQLQPIWSVPEKTDIGNLITHHLMEHPSQIPEWSKSELMASKGSALLRAKKSGLNLYLKEQHRSHPDLVAFANRLCYNNQIVALRTNIDLQYPAFGHGHVVGIIDSQLGSKGNRIEAQAVAHYLLKASTQIKQRYNVDKINDVVAIVTPFVRQVHWLKQELQKRFPADDIPNIGTVHAYQGSEKPIMVFSPVQSVHGHETPFFDLDYTMLNVAVSRAKDAFWYIGNLNGLQPRGLKPSAILASSMLRGHHQQLPNWILPFETPHDMLLKHPMSNDGKARLDTMRSFLAEQQSGNLHIASPYFSSDYLDEIDFWGWAHSAVKRGVTVIIHANKQIMTYHGDTQASDLVRQAASHGVQWQWHPALFDNRIWCLNRMAESSTSWGAPLNGGQWITYEGSTNLWCQAQIGSWGTPTKGMQFGVIKDVS